MKVVTVGLVVCLAGLCLFGGVASDVTRHGTLTRFDGAALAWVHAHATPTGYAVFTLISVLGSGLTMTLLAIGGGTALAVRRRWAVAGGLVATLAGAGLLDATLKNLFRRPRPAAAVVVPPSSWSFPSGHALASSVGYGMLAYLIVVYGTRRRSSRAAVVAGAAALSLAIGVSRVYLGVHYVSDVVGGFAMGVAWLSACMAGLEIARRNGRPPGGVSAP